MYCHEGRNSFHFPIFLFPFFLVRNLLIEKYLIHKSKNTKINKLLLEPFNLFT